jgi:methanogenic corrinoid protein MtbC1
MLSDLVVGKGFEVIDLGPDVPTASFVYAASNAARLIAVGVSVTTPGLDASVLATIEALHQHLQGVPVVVGGGAINDTDHAARLGADAYASDGREFVAVLQRLSGLEGPQDS